MSHWYEGPLAAFATETTGADVTADRIVSAALVIEPAPGEVAEIVRWLVDPGIPVPAASRALHGLSEEFLRLYGRHPAQVVDEVARELAGACAAHIPLVVPDAPYHLTLLDRELRRHRQTSLSAYFTGPGWCVLDPPVLDGHLDRHRRGGRTLADLCAHYAVPPSGTGEAAADAGTALAVARAIGRHHAGRLQTFTPAELHTRQAAWYAAQSRGRQSWLTRNGTPERRDPAWPVRPGPSSHAAA